MRGKEETFQFPYAYTTLRGDGGITARLHNVTGGHTDGWAKVGTMLRENTEAGARGAFMTYANGGVFEPTWRLGTNLTPTKHDEDTNGAGRPLGDRPIWIRSQRRGQMYEHLCGAMVMERRLVRLRPEDLAQVLAAQAHVLD